MQYYLFKEACATKETGPEYPQIQRWRPGYDDDKADSYYSYYNISNKGGTFPEFVPDMDALVMHDKAKPTDLISSGLSIGFIVSEKLKEIFERFKFPPYRFYRTKIIHQKIELSGYYFMHIISNYYSDYLDLVDYQKSTFIISGIGESNPQPISLKSKKDYLERAEQLQEEALASKLFRSIHTKKTYFNSNFDRELDYFNAPFGIDSYISKNLRDALVENKITGCNIESTDKILIDLY